ncbi:YfiR family protein [Geomonas sp.]|uniref:YfiR family protein n=1 Tax=Geomonas sp. TaxID=2651584 RepID=UPI002B45D412|nr:YfiR family protein [Geomonas sp.]HJV34228.1 YfiR family protein [Geomonas sp.]
MPTLPGPSKHQHQSPARSLRDGRVPSCARRFRLGALTLLCFSLCSLLPSHSLALSDSDELEAKAAFIYNFCKYIDWPADRFASSSSPIVITVFCHHFTYDACDAFDTIRGKSAGGRPLEVRLVKKADEIGTPHILYMCGSDRDHAGRIPESYRTQSILTVNDLDPATRCGGAIISFLSVDNKLRFQINLRAARKSGLKISSQLLKLATDVVE